MIYSGKQVENKKILQFLSTKIPDYMLPNQFYYTEEFPLNSNGKIDRKKLQQEYV